MEHCILFDLSMESQSLVSKEIRNRTNYIDSKGDHPPEGTGINHGNIAYSELELSRGKFLIKNELKEQAKEEIEFMKKHNKIFYLL